MKIGVQTGGVIENLGIERTYEIISGAGFEVIDWNIDHACSSAKIRSLDYEGNSIFEKSLNEIKEYYAEEIKAIKKYGLSITQAHAPWPAYIPGHPEVLEYCIKMYKKCIELCDYVGCKNLVIHGISLPYSNREDTAEDIDRLNMQLYESLIPTLLENNVTVCLENLFTNDAGVIVEGVCSDAHEAVRYIDTFNTKAGREVFGFCLDVGHLQLLGKNFRTYISVLGKRIKALHVHDNDSRSDLHLAPFTGRVHWDDLCDELNQIGYDGDLCFETFAQTSKALKFDESLGIEWLRLIEKIGESFRKRILK